MECYYLLLFSCSLDDYVQVLEKEVNIDFCRSMNQIIFDQTVHGDARTFAFVSVPRGSDNASPDFGLSSFKIP